MLTAALSKQRKNGICQDVYQGEWINITYSYNGMLFGVYKKEKKNRLLIHTTWMKLKNCWVKEALYYMIVYAKLHIGQN